MALESPEKAPRWHSRAPKLFQDAPPSRTRPSAPRWLSRTVSDPKIALVSSEDGPQNPQDKNSMPQQTFRTLGKSSRWHARSRHSPADREPPPGSNMAQHSHKKALRRLQDCPTPKGGPKSAHDASKMAQEANRWLQEGPRVCRRQLDMY